MGEIDNELSKVNLFVSSNINLKEKEIKPRKKVGMQG